ncbi:MAG: glycoside hydrolase N-terminal domain-containing protein [Bacteroidetes bacterium]|nr:glycoside hydrolase N-terminal domain-containing protein [Bacteroidota bacterium]
MLKIILSITSLYCSYTLTLYSQPLPKHDLNFAHLAATWDEGIPLGNGTIGALIWQKGEHLRFSLDRADIWDMRPMKGLHRKEFSYDWIYQQVQKKEYKIVQEYFDAPYDKEPAPSKIPAGALEFDLPNNAIKSVRLSLQKALCIVEWNNGMKLTTFVHATAPVGWFRFEHATIDILPQLIAPPYEAKIATGGEVNSLLGDDLARLGYKQGSIVKEGSAITYRQQGWNGFTYEINVCWKKTGKDIFEGVWSISSQYPNTKLKPAAGTITQAALQRGYKKDLDTHNNWWEYFWNQSAIHIPDTLLEKQWYLEQYKFGSAARLGAPPISLQAVWTADNGRIPPWKGDFHHDLNTELSYWPAYSANHLNEAMGFIDHLEANKANYERYTKLFFGKKGLAVPGVTTLDGTEMGGWVQYSLSPTVSSWLAQHFYLQWRYSMDSTFLREKAYPWFKSVCSFLEEMTTMDATGHRKLPMSSSPEINDNSINAWFLQNTNYDLALMKYVFGKAAELAQDLKLTSEADHWNKILKQFGDFSLSSNHELMFASTLPYNVSHRHFSHLMAIHPLGLIKWEDGPLAQTIIKNSIALLEKIGPDYWCGYSYAWLGNIQARAKNGDGAEKALSIFAKAFCLSNSFHVNGDQTKSGLSKLTYRPFTLEGNFAFAAGIQEMLLQSYAGFIEIMPAVPEAWRDISFTKLRAEGAFLINAQKVNGRITKIKIMAEKAGNTLLKLPFEKWKVISSSGATAGTVQQGFLEMHFKPGGNIVLGND